MDLREQLQILSEVALAMLLAGGVTALGWLTRRMVGKLEMRLRRRGAPSAPVPPAPLAA